MIKRLLLAIPPMLVAAMLAALPAHAQSSYQRVRKEQAEPKRMPPPSGRTMYADPIPVGAYVADPRAAIVEGARQNRWVVQEQSVGRVVLRLEATEVMVVNAVHYDAKSIRIEDVTQRLQGCTSNCQIDAGKLQRWRINLRRGILLQLQQLALVDAELNYQLAIAAAAPGSSTPTAAPTSQPK